jgi:hypothetical protein
MSVCGKTGAHLYVGVERPKSTCPRCRTPHCCALSQCSTWESPQPRRRPHRRPCHPRIHENHTKQRGHAKRAGMLNRRGKKPGGPVSPPRPPIPIPRIPVPGRPSISPLAAAMLPSCPRLRWKKRQPLWLKIRKPKPNGLAAERTQTAAAAEFRQRAQQRSSSSSKKILVWRRVSAAACTSQVRGLGCREYARGGRRLVVEEVGLQTIQESL